VPKIQVFERFFLVKNIRGYAGVPIKLTEDFGEWLGGFHWDTWMTGTFAGVHMTKDAYRARAKTEKWLYDGFQTPQCPISHMVAVEKFHNTDYCHIHMLIRGVGHIPYPELGQSWKGKFGGGMERVIGYERQKGANYYITKYTTKDMMDWNVSINQKHKNTELDAEWVRDSAGRLVRQKIAEIKRAKEFENSIGVLVRKKLVN
jgi:hypothetical protein